MKPLYFFATLAVFLSAPFFLYSESMMHFDTIPDLTEQTQQKEIVKLPMGKIVEVEMFEESIEDTDPDEMDTRRSSDLSCVTPIFAGKVRKFAKTVPQIGRSKSFSSLAALEAFLCSDSIMKFHSPPIDRSVSSQRVKEEQRNVSLKKVWLLAIYREEDNDYHLVLCDQPVFDSTATVFSAEISGLPDETAVSSRTMNCLEGVRKTLTDQLGDLRCGRTFMFKKGGLPVKIKGSLFFDIHHAGQVHGRQGLHPQSAWEIHPVTGLEWIVE